MPGETLTSQGSCRGPSPPRPRRRRLAASAVVFLVLSTVVVLGVFFSRNREAVRVLYNPDQLFPPDDPAVAPLDQKKGEILSSLNEELDRDNHSQKTDENRLLAQLDRLWRSFKRYLTPAPDQQPVEKAQTPAAVSKKGSAPDQVRVPAAAKDAAQENIVQNVLALARDQEVIRNASQPQDVGRAPGSAPQNSTQATQGLTKSDTPQAQVADRILDRPLIPTEGVRTRGVIWQVHRYLSLEGTLDTTHIGETDPDLRDFGLRSVQAFDFLREEPSAGVMKGWDKIDSGYPRSFGIGLNFRVSPKMQMLFDYSHEYPTDHFIEYTGDWESSLMADYAKKPQDDPTSVHNFFFGLRYLHREQGALLPFHTGFFYSTNMAEQSMPSDVSMGFSVGGGYQRQDMQFGITYRLRVWENPGLQTLPVQYLREEDLNTRVSNQVLFYLSF